MDWTPPKILKHLNETAAQTHFEDLIAALKTQGCDEATATLSKNSAFASFIKSVISYSPFLRDCMLQNPKILNEILTLGFVKSCSVKIEQTRQLGIELQDEAEIMLQLRKAKSQIAITCALADLGGWWDGEIVTRNLALFADACLQAALDFILLRASGKSQFKLPDIRYPQIDCGLIVLAMGKHGAFELNYSSDIDLILFYDEKAASAVIGIDPTSFFARTAKQLVKILQERTPEGYVFRVDLRLRPDPSSTPPIMPLEAGLIYYESYGQNWERAAMIKARPAAGDIVAGKALLKELTPFIWRKYLDYAAIQDVHSIKRQIHAHKGHGTIATHGHNIKLGRGGIREVEFFAQTQQLIAGGRMPQLRTIRTIETLEALSAHDWIDIQVVRELRKAYWYLRDVEHRLQMVRDEQTHTLPLDEEEFTRIAMMMGAQNANQFSAQLSTQLVTVEKHYSSLFEQSPDLSTTEGNLVFTGDDDDPQTIDNLSQMGYHRPSDIIRTIKGWHYGRYPALRTAQARELLTELTPLLLREFAHTGRADDTLIAMDRFIAGLPAGIQLFALLNSNPELLRLMTLILSAAPRLTKLITRRPHIFDGIIDPAFNNNLSGSELLAQRLDQFLSKGEDYEALLNRARIFAAEQKFLIGARILNDSINASQAGAAFSDLAEVLINAMVAIVMLEFENTHGSIEGGKICVLAMGRLGSRELTAGSDLDLIFLYEFDPEIENSNGLKPLPVSQYYTRLTQRLTAAMSAPTAEGVIYELDFRLRPSGKAGPLATHVQSFVKYQTEQAWTWEHQALTRARPVAGEIGLCSRVEAEIGKIIAANSNHAKMRADIYEMRQRIEKEIGTTNAWDCKNASGGLIDIEFCAQYLALRQGIFAQQSERNSRSIIRSAPEKYINENDRELLTAAHDYYTTILQILRACLDQEFDTKSASADLIGILCQALGAPDFKSADNQLKNFQRDVRNVFNRMLG